MPRPEQQYKTLNISGEYKVGERTYFPRDSIVTAEDAAQLIAAGVATEVQPVVAPSGVAGLVEEAPPPPESVKVEKLTRTQSKSTQ